MSRAASLAGRSALLTGAGSGIGRCLAGELARAGARLVLADRDATAVAETIDGQGIAGAVIGVVTADFLVDGECERMVGEALALAPRIDVLWNNAGIMALGQVRNLRWEDFALQLRVNLEIPVKTTHLLLPHLIEQGGGAIGFTASASGVTTPPGAGAYGLTKAGIVAFSEALRAEVARHGISVTTVCPGFVHTPLAWTATFRDDKTAQQTRNVPRFVGSTPERVARIGVRALAAGRGRVVVGSGEKLKHFLKNASPALYGLFNRGMARLLLDR